MKNKRVKQFIKFSSNTHLYFRFCLSTLHRICKRNADWFSNNIQPINILIEAWLTVARDLLYRAEQFTINARYQSAVNLSQ